MKIKGTIKWVGEMKSFASKKNEGEKVYKTSLMVESPQVSANGTQYTEQVTAEMWLDKPEDHEKLIQMFQSGQQIEIEHYFGSREWDGKYFATNFFRNLTLSAF